MATTMGVSRNSKNPKLIGKSAETWEALENTMSRLEFTATSLNNGNFDDILLLNLTVLAHSLPNYAHIIEEAYQVPLDRAFKIFRNACQNENLSPHCRVNLMALIERRAMDWKMNDAFNNYYKNKIPSPEGEPQPVRVDQFQGAHSPLPNMLSPTVPLLGPGEQIKSSGRFPQPTRIPGKNYFKDEVVINNSDSGKVMGIKGRRVHMIEELSETIISFQRVTPGVKERLVQITGPNETKINEAIHLMGDTIRRNASPVPFRVDQPDLGSSSSVNSSASEESNRIQTGHPQSSHRLQHSFSTNDASPEYKHTVTVGPHTIKLTGTNYDLVSESKILLERHFGDRNLNNQFDDVFFHEDQFIPEDKVYPCEVKQTVTRQPLFPEAPRSVFEQVETSGRPADLSARNRRAFFGQTNTEKEKAATPAPKKHLRYSREMMYLLAGSKMSTLEPDDWEVLCPPGLIRDKVRRGYNPPYAQPSSKAHVHHLHEDFEALHPNYVRTTSLIQSSPLPEETTPPNSVGYDYNLPSAISSSPKLKRRVSFDLNPPQDLGYPSQDFGYVPQDYPIRQTPIPPSVNNPLEPLIFERVARSRSITPSALELALTPGVSPPLSPSLTSILYPQSFMFTKKSSLPEMNLEATVPFLRSQSTPGPSTDVVPEVVAPKETKSFRPQLTNPRLANIMKAQSSASP